MTSARTCLALGARERMQTIRACSSLRSYAVAGRPPRAPRLTGGPRAVHRRLDGGTQRPDQQEGSAYLADRGKCCKFGVSRTPQFSSLCHTDATTSEAPVGASFVPTEPTKAILLLATRPPALMNILKTRRCEGKQNIHHIIMLRLREFSFTVNRLHYIYAELC